MYSIVSRSESLKIAFCDKLKEIFGMEKNIEVGKFTLESLTTGMYSDPKIIYRGNAMR